jgi:hypothetical protein
MKFSETPLAWVTSGPTLRIQRGAPFTETLPQRYVKFMTAMFDRDYPPRVALTFEECVEAGGSRMSN